MREPESTVKGGPVTFFKAINVFHRGPYEPPLRSSRTRVEWIEKRLRFFSASFLTVSYIGCYLANIEGVLNEDGNKLVILAKKSIADNLRFMPILW